MGMSMNPSQLKKGTAELLVLLKAMQDPQSFAVQVKEMDEKLRNLDIKIEEIKRLTGIVDTLAEAENIRGQADAYKESVEIKCAEMKTEAKLDYDDSQHRINEMLAETRDNKEETHRLLNDAKSAHDSREATIKAAENKNTAHAEANAALEERLIERQLEVDEKLKKLNAALAA